MYVCTFCTGADKWTPHGACCSSAHVMSQWPRTKPYNEVNVLMSVPATINLSNGIELEGTNGTKTSIASLPTELHWKIFAYLIPVDRVCFALTCKKLAASLVSNQRLSTWIWLGHRCYGYQFFVPETYRLVQRLAHGWINKKKFRYCWKCRKILPRDTKYFNNRLKRKWSPKWNPKVGMSKEQWQNLSKKRRYQHLIKLWSEAEWEDSSCYSCDECRAGYIDACRDRILKFAEHMIPLGSYQPAMQEAALCPCCLEEELTWKAKRRKRSYIPPWLRKILGFVWDVVRFLILVVCYVIFVTVPAPFKYGNKLRKKAARKWHLGDKLARLKWWKKPEE